MTEKESAQLRQMADQITDRLRDTWPAISGMLRSEVWGIVADLLDKGWAAGMRDGADTLAEWHPESAARMVPGYPGNDIILLDAAVGALRRKGDR